MKAIKRAYSASGGGVDMESMQELYFGSIEEREALADAITNKGVATNVTDSLITMSENVNNIKKAEVDSGSVSVNIGSNGASASKHVNFNKTFSKVPVVAQTNPYRYHTLHGFSNITTTGFDMTTQNNGVAAYTVNWIAVAQ